MDAQNAPDCDEAYDALNRKLVFYMEYAAAKEKEVETLKKCLFQMQEAAKANQDEQRR